MWFFKGGLFIIISCSTSDREYSIDFCTSLNSAEECINKDNNFKVGDKVYVMFECNKPFRSKVITGKFYKLDFSINILRGTQNWTINPEDSYAYDFIEFKGAGNYKFEFINEEGEVLAVNELVVNE